VNRKNLRSQAGQAFVPLVIIAILVVGVVGIFAFEIGRAAMIRDQLRAATEASALAGAATLAGASSLDPLASQTNAMAGALDIFKRNEIFGVPLTNVENDFDNEPRLGHAKIRMSYLDPKNNNAPVALGDPKAKILLVETKFGFTPVFASMIGMAGKVFPVEARAEGGVGDLDVVMVFDFSGSMDDETIMTQVSRRWDPAAGKIDYHVVTSGKLARSSGAVPPQQLEMANGFNPDLRGRPNVAGPPGNFPPGAASPTGFTDEVVNLDENASFGGVTVDGFSFPNVGVLVEAARGNLESAGAFHASQADTALAGVVSPRPGYQAAYFKEAHKHIHPLFDAQEAAGDFFNLMNKNSNAHFGLVAFDDRMGITPTQTFTQPNIATSYMPGGIGNFPIPGVPLKKPEDQTNFPQVVTSIDSLVAFGGTNIGGGVDAAINQFTGGARDNAKKVIILFTDGEPTAGGPLSNSPEQNCILAAQKAKTKGIAIYTVGLALNPALIPIQQQILGDHTATGMASIAGNGGRYFPVTSTNNLRSAFASIARHLSQLTE
jgi:hypothetical protein